MKHKDCVNKFENEQDCPCEDEDCVSPEKYYFSV
jgi:hypothetical protein